MKHDISNLKERFRMFVTRSKMGSYNTHYAFALLYSISAVGAYWFIRVNCGQ